MRPMHEKTVAGLCCPFCGSGDRSTFLDTVHTDVTRYAVRCRSCGAQGPARPTPEGAEAAWERRYES